MLKLMQFLIRLVTTKYTQSSALRKKSSQLFYKQKCQKILLSKSKNFSKTSISNMLQFDLRLPPKIRQARRGQDNLKVISTQQKKLYSKMSKNVGLRYLRHAPFSTDLKRIYTNRKYLSRLSFKKWLRAKNLVSPFPFIL